MSHEIEIVDGKAGFFAVGQPAWHGLGTILDAPPSIAEGLKLAGLEWTVTKKPLKTDDDIEVPNHVAVVRSTDNKVLGVVGKDYSELQNQKAFDWFQPWLDSGVATLESAGCLYGGKKVWVMAKVKGLMADVVKDDPVESYILLSNSHDGTASVRSGFTFVRTVCANTLAMAFNDKRSKLIKVRHKGNVNDTLDKIRETMNVFNREFNATMDQYRALAQTPIDPVSFRKYVQVVFAPTTVNPTEIQAEPEERRNLENQLVELFENGVGMTIPGVAGSLWAAFNAVTEFTTHHRGRSNDARLNSLWFGQSFKVNEKALQEATRLARVLLHR